MPHDTLDAVTVPISSLAHETLVHIGIVQDPDPKRRIHIFPQRGGEATVFHRRNRHVGSPARPTEIRWIVTGLAAGQRLRLRMKAGQDEAVRSAVPAFSTGRRHLEFKGPETATETSGPLRGGPGRGRSWNLDYDVLLFDGEPPELVASLDPTIVIEEDP